MVAILIAPVIISLALGLFGQRLGRALPPAVAVTFLTAAALVTALSTFFVLVVLGGLVTVAQLGPLADAIGVSGRALDATDPVPTSIAVIAGTLVVMIVVRAARQIARSIRDLRAASRLCEALGPHVDGLVVTDDAQPDAFAISGLRTGRVVVSRAMLRALRPAERRVLLAHEAAHLDRHHHVYVQITDLAAAINPLLRPVRREVRVGVERWADEIAATRSGNREIVARALARAGLARHRFSRTAPPTTALAGTEVDLGRRVDALLGDRPRRRPILAALVATVMLGLVLSSAAAAENAGDRLHYADTIFDRR